MNEAKEKTALCTSVGADERQSVQNTKFIFNLMNFPKHSCFEMTNLFDILKKNYKLIEGVGENGGYHAQVFMSSLFSQMDFS